MSIQESDILSFVGGACWEQFGTPTRRTTVPRRGGEEDVETFSRTGAVGVYRGGDAVLHTAEANTPRGWFQDQDTDGILEPYLLLERAGTNLCIRSAAFDHAAWTKTGASVSANGNTGPFGTVTMDRLTEDSSTGEHSAESTAMTITADADVAGSVYADPDTRNFLALEISDGSGNTATQFFNLLTGAVGTANTAGTGSVIAAGSEIADAAELGQLFRCGFSCNIGSGATSVTLKVLMADADNSASYTGNGTAIIRLEGAQLEEGAEWSSQIPTTTVAVTRNADLFTVPFYSTPHAMQWYCRFIEGSRTTGDRLFQLGQTDNSDPRFLVDSVGTAQYRSFHDPAGSSVTSTITLNQSPGDLVELLATLNADGSTSIKGRLNGGAITTGSTSSAAALATAWSAPLLTVNSQSNGTSNKGVRRYHALIPARGTGYTLDEFAALV